MSDWFASSYMARKGVAGGKPGRTHQLSEAAQGQYQYVYGGYAKPVLTISPGDVVVAETLDAFGGAIKTVDDLPSQKLNMPFVNARRRAHPRRAALSFDAKETSGVAAADKRAAPRARKIAAPSRFSGEGEWALAPRAEFQGQTGELR